MTTVTFTTAINPTTNAGFQTACSELQSNLITAGLILTTDTGQINVATVNSPSPNGAPAGYNIFKLPDSSLYIKLEYKLDGYNTMSFNIQVGEGSNGSGTLTGAISTSSGGGGNNYLGSTTTAYPTYICVTNGFFGLLYKVGSIIGGSTAGAFFAVSRTYNNTNTPSNLGYSVTVQPGQGSGMTKQFVRRASPATTYTKITANAGGVYIVPGNVASSLDALGNYQSYTQWMVIPEVIPDLNLVGYVVSDLPNLTTFTSSIIGSYSHTYLTLGNNILGTAVNGGNTTYSTAMLWE